MYYNNINLGDGLYRGESGCTCFPNVGLIIPPPFPVNVALNRVEINGRVYCAAIYGLPSY
jgi:hypothetical protein